MSQLVLAEGAVFAERYRVIRCIAQGGMGAVYEVVHIETKKHRALKVMLPNMVEAKGMQDRFQQEAHVTSGIESEFIVEVMDAGIDAATRMPFLVMELLRGEDLNQRLSRVGRMSFQDALTLLRQVAMALDKTHRASIVHRDLKPENLFLTERDDGSPRVKILDFGVAKMLSDSATNARATQSLGTPLYMSPEQFQAGGAVSPATDIYALAFISYTLLVGKPYWHDEMEAGTNIYAFVGVAQQGMRESPVERARRRGVVLPVGFDAWCAKAAAVRPADRFGNALEAMNSLAEVLGVALGQTGSEGRASAWPGAPASTGVSISGSPSSSWKHTVPLESGLSVGSGALSQKVPTGAGLSGTGEGQKAEVGKAPKRGLWAVGALFGAAVIGGVGMYLGRGKGEAPEVVGEVDRAALVVSAPVVGVAGGGSAGVEIQPVGSAAASAAAVVSAAPSVTGVPGAPKGKTEKAGGISMPKASTSPFNPWDGDRR